ncbi:hypothetical protein ACTMQO_12385 [Escherichia coli]
MKKSTLALVVMGIVASVSVQAAEIYNKDGNKLDVYGKVKAMHYMVIMTVKMATRVISVLVLKAKHKLTIN